MSNTTRRTILVAAATILFAAASRPDKENTQGARAPKELQLAQQVQISLDSGKKASQEADVAKLMSKTLSDNPGKEVLMVTVNYPPGGSSAVHRHNAQAFVYVLEGSVVMGVKGDNPVTLMPGQTFYEGPSDIHTVSRNASNTKPAKFLAFLIKDKDAPVSIPVK